MVVKLLNDMKRRLYVDWLIFYRFFNRDNSKFAAIYAWKFRHP